ncbi:hypothetical protein [Trebonia sp.]|uniref:hypothetical protein n=1 Tax=Trebonia sp. TaxID=2767075 RepID=UPI0026199F63|nr:hypothetical protein [Trebonia sp.]
MEIAAVAGAAVVLLVIMGMSVYAARTLPPDAQIPIHHGIGGYNNWVSKSTGLVIWAAIGAVIFVITAVTAASAHAGSKSTPSLILPFVLLVVACGQYGAIRAAQRQGGGAAGQFRD